MDRYKGYSRNNRIQRAPWAKNVGLEATETRKLMNEGTVAREILF